MKPLPLGLLPLLLKLPAAGPAPVRVTLDPLHKAAYLTAQKAAVSTGPAMTFPPKKGRGDCWNHAGAAGAARGKKPILPGAAEAARGRQ